MPAKHTGTACLRPTWPWSDCLDRGRSVSQEEAGPLRRCPPHRKTENGHYSCSRPFPACVKTPQGTILALQQPESGNVGSTGAINRRLNLKAGDTDAIIFEAFQG